MAAILSFAAWVDSGTVMQNKNSIGIFFKIAPLFLPFGAQKHYYTVFWGKGKYIFHEWKTRSALIQASCKDFNDFLRNPVRFSFGSYARDAHVAGDQ